MKMVKYLLQIVAILSFVLYPNVTSARLGETPNELVARFGQPISQNSLDTFDNAQNAIYKSGVFKVQVLFINGKCERISYQKDFPFSDDEVNQLLEQNGQGFTWGNLVRVRTDVSEYDRSDGGKCSWVHVNFPQITKVFWAIEFQSGLLMRLQKEKDEIKTQQINSASGFDKL